MEKLQKEEVSVGVEGQLQSSGHQLLHRAKQKAKRRQPLFEAETDDKKTDRLSTRTGTTRTSLPRPSFHRARETAKERDALFAGGPQALEAPREVIRLPALALMMWSVVSLVSSIVSRRRSSRGQSTGFVAKATQCCLSALTTPFLSLAEAYPKRGTRA